MILSSENSLPADFGYDRHVDSDLIYRQVSCALKVGPEGIEPWLCVVSYLRECRRFQR